MVGLKCRTKRANRTLVFCVCGGLLVGVIFLGFLVSCGAHSLQVAVKFVHQDAYPNAVVLVWVTNSSVRPILLEHPEVRFRSGGGSESLSWSDWDLPPDWPLQPGAVASFSLAAWEGEAQERLIFRYTYEEPLRRAISPVVRVGAHLFGLKPLGNRDSHNTWWWLARHGLLDGHVHPVYDGTWVRWEKM
jgi:hypothetical protein